MRGAVLKFIEGPDELLKFSYLVLSSFWIEIDGICEGVVSMVIGTIGSSFANSTSSSAEDIG
jgi:hypothetical protein